MLARDRHRRRQLLELEITESALMHDTAERIVDAAARCADAGRAHRRSTTSAPAIRRSAYLKRFPIDKLKIDRSFVRDAGRTRSRTTRAIVARHHRAGAQPALRVVAEGVETAEQLAFLRAHGCDDAQGYLFSRPLPAEGITRLLEKAQPAIPALPKPLPYRARSR